MAEYMEDHVGEEFTGMIVTVMPFGMFVELPNKIEGLVHVTDMKDDHYLYDEFYQTMTGDRTGKKHKLGDEIKVRCIRASKEERKIDFELV